MHPAVTIGVSFTKGAAPAAVRGAAAQASPQTLAPFHESMKSSLGDVLPVAKVAPGALPAKTETGKAPVAFALELKVAAPTRGVAFAGKSLAHKAPGQTKGEVARPGNAQPKPEMQGAPVVSAEASPVQTIAGVAEVPLPVVVAGEPQSEGEAQDPPLEIVANKSIDSTAPVAPKGQKVEAGKVVAEGLAPVPAGQQTPRLDALVPTMARNQAAHEVRSEAVAPSPIAVAGASNVATFAAKPVESLPLKRIPEVAAQSTDLKTLTATPNVLEVGVASGSHGWLRVRAELGPAGEVAASMAAASTGAAEMLHKELPAISAYLAEERVGVGSLVVRAMERSAGSQDSALTANAGSAPGSQQGTGQRRKDAGIPTSPVRRGDGVVDIDAVAGLAAIGQAWMSRGVGNGGWVSVRV